MDAESREPSGLKLASKPIEESNFGYGYKLEVAADGNGSSALVSLTMTYPGGREISTWATASGSMTIEEVVRQLCSRMAADFKLHLTQSVLDVYAQMDSGLPGHPELFVRNKETEDAGRDESR